MTKFTTITCDECDADITKSSFVTISNKDIHIPSLCLDIHFCGYKHMYAYLNKVNPDKEITNEI